MHNHWPQPKCCSIQQLCIDFLCKLGATACWIWGLQPINFDVSPNFGNMQLIDYISLALPTYYCLALPCQSEYSQFVLHHITTLGLGSDATEKVLATTSEGRLGTGNLQWDVTGKHQRLRRASDGHPALPRATWQRDINLDKLGSAWLWSYLCGLAVPRPWHKP